MTETTDAAIGMIPGLLAVGIMANVAGRMFSDSPRRDRYGSCGGTRRRDGSGRRVGNCGTSRQPKKNERSRRDYSFW